jgi:hypothetical protein
MAADVVQGLFTDPELFLTAPQVRAEKRVRREVTRSTDSAIRR